MAQKTALLILLCLQLWGCFFPLCTATTEHCRKLKEKDDQIKGMFVFGSSLVDNGNNNYLEDSTAKADFLPYGIDFPHGPSGRFTNGKNVIDLLGEKLKLPCLIPVFSDPSTKGEKVVHGVNFASGSSGILDDTGFLAVRRYLILFYFPLLFCFIEFHTFRIIHILIVIYMCWKFRSS